MSFVFVFYFAVKCPSTIGKAIDNCVCVGQQGAGVSTNTTARRVLIHEGHDSVADVGSNF